MVLKNQYVMIKGTRDGLTLFLDDSCSFNDLLDELDKTLSHDEFDEDQAMITVKIHLGNRFLHKEQDEQLRTLIRQRNKLVVQGIESNVISKAEAIQWKEDSEVRVVSKTIRSGQVYQVQGDLLLIGDINPGGTVKATGNIYIMGALRGVAHAGINGNRQAVIIASFMKPVQLRIADLYSRAPDYETEGVYMECGFIDESEKILIDRLQLVAKKRPELNGFERSVLNG
ncbi:septum site-determining protein MinC [Amphibacillus marinus]|uniref:Probable septum site-determining protein MinC n=1 Tax=Amphibacillus marinus TaxID=872970 RepID=A0A1H8P3C5_9BACI|nr:septum site-determining protein MinC [Amphibacillus marinus]SEO36043.1 septum site-determining protein MinC [Amphibacillus marinus]